MSQKSFLTGLLAACTLSAPALVHARTVVLTTQLKPYGGDGAYLAVYLINAQGAYAGTLWVAGGKAKYYRHLSDWNRLSAGDAKRLAGVTGASVGAGRTLTVNADLADALIDAGYEIRIDVAAEDLRDSPAEIRAPLNTANAKKSYAGKQYIQTFTYQFR